MDTLKFATLTLLIPFGWIMTDSAAAYPEPLQQIELSGDRDTKKGCMANAAPSKTSALEAEAPQRPETIAIETLLAELKSQPQGHASRANVCRFDLERIEVD